MVKIFMALLIGVCLVTLAASCGVFAVVAASNNLSNNGTFGTNKSVIASGIPVIPTKMLSLYHAAAKSCPGLSWSILAAIGSIESNNGTSSLPGVDSGSNYMGAEGPMQFEPTTFAAYATVGPGGAIPPSPYDPVDAVYTAATMLCANGASSPSGLSTAIYDYNHSFRYVEEVLEVAKRYRRSMGANQ